MQCEEEAQKQNNCMEIIQQNPEALKSSRKKHRFLLSS
ncbi:hypothetical protein SOVF_045870 [Spinacia oleracea]|nr:hypothetical protein SOVF_045870 [Spinacia oleracea]